MKQKTFDHLFCIGYSHLNSSIYLYLYYFIIFIMYVFPLCKITYFFNGYSC